MILTSVMTAVTFPIAPTLADMAHMPPHNRGDCNQSNSHAPHCAHGAAGALGALARQPRAGVPRVVAEGAERTGVRFGARRGEGPGARAGDRTAKYRARADA